MLMPVSDPTPEPTEERRPTSDSVAGRRVRHYKGGIYIVIGEALHTETEEPLIVYTSDSGRTWARPEVMFSGTVEVDGNLVPRFALLAAEPEHLLTPATIRKAREWLTFLDDDSLTGVERNLAQESGPKYVAELLALIDRPAPEHLPE